MLDEQEPWDDDTKIDPEVWAQALLAMTGDKDRRESLFEKSRRRLVKLPKR